MCACACACACARARARVPVISCLLTGKGLRCDGDTSKCVCNYGMKHVGDHCEYCKYLWIWIFISSLNMMTTNGLRIV